MTHMWIYSIFDDFDVSAEKTIRNAGIMLDIHPEGSQDQMMH